MAETCQRGTEIVELNGDLNGKILYHVTAVRRTRVGCELKVAGTGKTTDGNPTFSYTGTCRFRAAKMASKH
jgi:Lon protease-like protein